MSVKLFYRTTAWTAKSIEAVGFRDTFGNYGMCIPFKGVWFADVPVSCQEGSKQGDEDDVILEVTLDRTEKDIALYELVEDQGPDPMFRLRWWCIPAEVINAHGEVRHMGWWEENENFDPTFLAGPLPLTDETLVSWRKSRGFESGGLSYFDAFPEHRAPKVRQRQVCQPTPVLLP